jgi:SsrA-binding protein
MGALYPSVAKQSPDRYIKEGMAQAIKGEGIIVKNKRAFHDYAILGRMEAGISLLGTEVKSVKMGNIDLKDGYCFIRNGEMYLRNVHIGPYPYANRMNHEPMRERKLLLHGSEIRKLHAKTREKGLTLIPLQVYVKKGRVKLEIGLVRGKRLYDKKEAIRKKDVSKDLRDTYRTSDLSGRLK